MASMQILHCTNRIGRLMLKSSNGATERLDRGSPVRRQRIRSGKLLLPLPLRYDGWFSSSQPFIATNDARWILLPQRALFFSRSSQINHLMCFALLSPGGGQQCRASSRAPSAWARMHVQMNQILTISFGLQPAHSHDAYFALHKLADRTYLQSNEIGPPKSRPGKYEGHEDERSTHFQQLAQVPSDP
jgi:hypothetical protein